MPFRTNDIIQNKFKGGSLGHIRQCNETYYFVSWLGGGDSMLWSSHTDMHYEKVGEMEPGTTDEILWYGRMLDGGIDEIDDEAY